MSFDGIFELTAGVYFLFMYIISATSTPVPIEHMAHLMLPQQFRQQFTCSLLYTWHAWGHTDECQMIILWATSSLALHEYFKLRSKALLATESSYFAMADSVD